MSTLSLRARAFYLIRAHDVELGEDFFRRCPELHSISELNRFFHLLLTQYPQNTHPQRLALLDCESFEGWSVGFVQVVLPFLRTERFPECTHQHLPMLYEPQQHAVA